MLLKNDQLTLRALEAEDLDLIYRWENDTTAWDSSSNHAPFSRKQIWEYITNYSADIYSTGQLRFIITLNPTATPVGMIDLFEFDPINRRASVGLLIDAAYRDLGLGRTAVGLLEDYCYHRLGLHQLVATIAADNKASIAMFRAAGYTISGRLASWLRHGESYTDAFLLQHLLIR